LKVFATEKIFRNLSSALNPARNFSEAWLIPPVTISRRSVRDDLQMTKAAIHTTNKLQRRYRKCQKPLSMQEKRP
jgi:hypothetical protein